MRPSKEEYAKKIGAATPLELTLINHELLLANMEDAMAAAAQSAECKTALDAARECLAALFLTLDMDLEISKDLGALYMFVNKTIIHAGIKRRDNEKNPLLAVAIDIMTQMQAAWRALEKDETAGAVIAQRQKIVEELLSGKGHLIEEYEDFNPNRGYKA